MKRAILGFLLTVSAVMTATTANADVLLSDSFNRTTGRLGVVGAFPPDNGENDWGSFDNAFGGAVTPTPYIMTPSDAAVDRELRVEITDGQHGIINSDPLFLDHNFGADPVVQAASGLRIRVDVNPNDNGGSGDHGRDWLAIILADTKNNTESIQNDTVITGSNVDARVGLGIRNSGSSMTRRAIAPGTGGATLERFSRGVPGEINEPIFDAATYDDYVTHYNSNVSTPENTPEFTNPLWYTVELRVFKAGATESLFDTDAEHRVEAYIGPQGGTLERIDFNVATAAVEDQFFWGDNETTTNVEPDVDETPGVNDAYLVLSSNAYGGTGHRFDNLIIETIDAGPSSPADFDNDNDVDGVDLAAWRTAFGTTSNGGDADDDGDSDGQDFLVWQRELTGASVEPVATAVPEPAALAVAMSLIGLIAIGRRCTH